MDELGVARSLRLVSGRESPPWHKTLRDRASRPEPDGPHRAVDAPTILVVDDDSTVRASLERVLRSRGYTVVTAPDGVSGFDAFVRLAPALVMADVCMPGLDGIELCKRIKNSAGGATTPVVLMTGLRAPRQRLIGFKAGADDHVPKPFRLAEVLKRVESLLDLKHDTENLEQAEAALLALGRSVESRDPNTEGHCERLSRNGADLGRRLGLPDDQITALDRAGLLHDIGKVAVPDSVLLKAGPLNESEWMVMREHPVTGEHICRPIKAFRSVLSIVRHHHERLDGSGYPDGLCNDEIPFPARVLQVVDVFDALVSKRPYKRALSIEKAIATLQREVERGWWDALVVEAFTDMVLGDAACWAERCAAGFR